ncbi:MAG: polyprenyl diphosphate synthase [Desulfovibrionaceae bacterium]
MNNNKTVYFPSLKHLAIIMDGNGRWAKEQDLPRSDGHKQGGSVAHTVIQECARLRIPTLTLYAFSKENWKRSKAEIRMLFSYFILSIYKKIEILVQNNIRLTFLGELDTLPSSVKIALHFALKQTQKLDGMQLNIAFNYSGREEIIQACKKMCSDSITPDSITEEYFSSCLYTKGQADPDLIVRTGGEERLSNFLIFQSAYSEFYCSQTYWPDFSVEELHIILRTYETRNRRFGAEET